MMFSLTFALLCCQSSAQSFFLTLLLVSFAALPHTRAHAEINRVFDSQDPLNDRHNPCHGSILRRKVANPDNCSAYFECIVGLPFPRKCNAEKIFDASRSTCVLGNQETCEIYVPTTTTEATTTTTTTRRPPPDLDAICHDIFFAAKRYADDPRLYVGCIRGRPLLLSCGRDEVFDENVNECG